MFFVLRYPMGEQSAGFYSLIKLQSEGSSVAALDSMVCNLFDG